MAGSQMWIILLLVVATAVASGASRIPFSFWMETREVDYKSLEEFNKADTDQDGFVTPEEMKHYLQTGLKKKKTHSLQWVTEWMKRMDQGDGKYNYEEWKMYV
ncbi:hypothetical protein ACROYT_G023824 [Oculina patagonica]